MVSRPVTRDDRPAPRPDARRRGRRARRWVIALKIGRMRSTWMCLPVEFAGHLGKSKPMYRKILRLRRRAMRTFRRNFRHNRRSRPVQKF